MKNNMNRVICLVLATIFLISTNVFALKTNNNIAQNDNEVNTVTRFIENQFKNYESKTTFSEQDDIDPLVDLAVTVTIKDIRALGKIDLVGNPDFYVKIFINGVEHTSSIWHNQKYVKPNWSVTQDVPDDKEFVNITIQLWDRGPVGSKLCDISPTGQGATNTDDYDVDLMYSLKSGHWTGDDYIYPNPLIFDPSGYGRLNGCDDNSIYQNDRDCELLFDITQNDYDGDGIPYWTEVNVFCTDPTIDNRGWDNDSDCVPIEWEFKWGHYFSYDWHHNEVEDKWIYDPFVWDDHRHLDPDEDGLDNVEEYLASQWGSDPFRKDIFIEIDQMAIGPNGEGEFLPELSKDLLIDAFSKHNIALHIDDGCMGGGEMIPYDNSTTDEELQNLYFNYFLDGNANNWRRGAFHYCLIIYHSARYPGFVFETTVHGENYRLDSLQISTKQHRKLPLNNKYLYKVCNPLIYKSFNRKYQKAVVYAGAIMHETGHILGIFNWNIPGADNFDQKYRNYRSCMNYRYVYLVVDYSDGSRGKNDFDDWDFIDLTLFQK